MAANLQIKGFLPLKTTTTTKKQTAKMFCFFPTNIITFIAHFNSTNYKLLTVFHRKCWAQAWPVSTHKPPSVDPPPCSKAAEHDIMLVQNQPQPCHRVLWPPPRLPSSSPAPPASIMSAQYVTAGERWSGAVANERESFCASKARLNIWRQRAGSFCVAWS